MNYLRQLWRPIFLYNWTFGLFLILLFGIPRFIIVLRSNVSGNYGPTAIIFLLMWFVPLIFLPKLGRIFIGMKRPTSYLRLIYSFAIGVLSCAAIFSLFYLLFDKSIDNAFAYIGKSGMTSSTISSTNRLLYFLIAVIPSMIFSPIGEELLYRGVIHGSFVGEFGETKASIFDSLAFALTHLAHYGIVYDAGDWHFLTIPALLWVISMFVVSQLFFRCKQLSSSIYGAVFAHSGFNFAMMYFIFYHL